MARAKITINYKFNREVRFATLIISSDDDFDDVVNLFWSEYDKPGIFCHITITGESTKKRISIPKESVLDVVIEER